LRLEADETDFSESRFSATRTSRGRIGLRFFLDGYNVNDLYFDDVPNREQIPMGLAFREGSALPNYDFATTAPIQANS